MDFKVAFHVGPREGFVESDLMRLGNLGPIVL